MYKDAPVQFNYYSMVEARALVTNYYQPTRARRLWRHYLSSLTGGAGSLLLTVVFYPLFSRRMDTRYPASLAHYRALHLRSRTGHMTGGIQTLNSPVVKAFFNEMI